MWANDGHSYTEGLLNMFKKFLCAVIDSQYFSLQTDETTVTQEATVMLRYFDNSLGKVRCLFHV